MIINLENNLTNFIKKNNLKLANWDNVRDITLRILNNQK